MMKAVMILGVVATAYAQTAPGTCFIAEQKDVAIGGCAKKTIRYGSCLSLDDAKAKLSEKIDSYKQTPPADDAACAKMINDMCTQYGGTADTTKCSKEFCSYLFRAYNGCTSDTQCTSPGETPQFLVCCGYLKSVADDLCKIDEKNVLAYVSDQRSKKQCSDLMCIARASSSASVSFIMLLVSAVLGLFMASRV
eukprot:762774-Hanusia_phi.AAC.1